MKAVLPALIAGLLGMMTMGAFGPPLAVRVSVAVGLCLLASIVLPARIRIFAFGLAVAIGGALTLLVGYATVKLAFDEGTAAAALTMFVVGAATTITALRASSEATPTSS